MLKEFHPPNYFYPSFLDRSGCTSHQDFPKQGTSSSKLHLFYLTDNLRLEAKRSLLKKKKKRSGGGEIALFGVNEIIIEINVDSSYVTDFSLA